MAYRVLRALVYAQRADRALWRLSRQGRIGVYTPIAGQEAAQVGSTLALNDGDWMVPTFRDLGAQLTRGEPLENVLLLHLGFAEGSVKRHGNLPFAAPVASQLPHAAGLAWAELLDRSGAAVLAFLGDGATSKGDFHEALTLAGVSKLPVVFLCQNNQWALSTPLSSQTAAPTLAHKALGYGMHGAQVDGTDVVAVHGLVVQALAAARRGKGPTLIEATAPRQGPHSTSDDPTLYDGPTGTEGEDSVERFRRHLVDAGYWSDADQARLVAQVDADIAAAIAAAFEHAESLAGDEIFTHVFAEQPATLRAQQQMLASDAQTDPPLAPSDAGMLPEIEGSGDSMTMARALGKALHEELARNPDTLLLGQDVGRLGGVFRISQGLLETFGPERVVDTPLAESAVVGAGIGLALAGKRPICEIQFAGFITAALDQLRNHAGRFRSRTRSLYSVPMVVRAPYGAGVGAPETHSESVEMLFVRVPGLKVVVPSSPRRARALLKAAIRDPDPVIFLEPIALYRTVREVVPEAEELLPIGQSFLLRPGKHVTAVSYGAMVRPTLEAAETLAEQDVSVEVIDLATLSPLDSNTVLGSVQNTGRLLVVHEGVRSADIGAELLARLHGALGTGFTFARVCGWDVPLPLFGRERAFLPSPRRIARAARGLLEGP